MIWRLHSGIDIEILMGRVTVYMANVSFEGYILIGPLVRHIIASMCSKWFEFCILS